MQCNQMRRAHGLFRCHLSLRSLHIAQVLAVHSRGADALRRTHDPQRGTHDPQQGRHESQQSADDPQRGLHANRCVWQAQAALLSNVQVGQGLFSEYKA